MLTNQWYMRIILNVADIKMAADGVAV